MIALSTQSQPENLYHRQAKMYVLPVRSRHPKLLWYFSGFTGGYLRAVSWWAVFMVSQNVPVAPDEHSGIAA